MSIRKIKDSSSNLDKALNRLEECFKNEHIDDFLIDAAIHRFETVIRLTWKLLDRSLSYEGIIPESPRKNLKLAYSINWIDNELIWLKILGLNEQIIHAYIEDKIAPDLFKQIKTVIPEINRLSKFLKDKLESYEETTKRQHAV